MYKINKQIQQNISWKSTPIWPYKFGLSREAVFGDRFNYIEMYDLLSLQEYPVAF